MSRNIVIILKVNKNHYATRYRSRCYFKINHSDRYELVDIYSRFILPPPNFSRLKYFTDPTIYTTFFPSNKFSYKHNNRRVEFSTIEKMFSNFFLYLETAYKNIRLNKKIRRNCVLGKLFCKKNCIEWVYTQCINPFTFIHFSMSKSLTTTHITLLLPLKL